MSGKYMICIDADVHKLNKGETYLCFNSCVNDDRVKVYTQGNRYKGIFLAKRFRQPNQNKQMELL